FFAASILASLASGPLGPSRCRNSHTNSVPTLFRLPLCKVGRFLTGGFPSTGECRHFWDDEKQKTKNQNQNHVLSVSASEYLPGSSLEERKEKKRSSVLAPLVHPFLSQRGEGEEQGQGQGQVRSFR